MVKKAKLAPALALSLIATGAGLAPANAVTSDLHSLDYALSADAYEDQSANNGDLQFYAADNYKGPMRNLDECKKVADFLQGRHFKITRECRRHDDGKWWFKASA